MAEKKSPFAVTLDREPTWESLLEGMLEAVWKEWNRSEPYEDFAERRDLVLGEFTKMARAADAYRALQKAGKVP